MMTAEQQKLAEENHNLIYGYAEQNDIDLDEYYDVLAIGLCKAAIRYNENKGKFSTFAFVTMGTEYLKILRDTSKKASSRRPVFFLWILFLVMMKELAQSLLKQSQMEMSESLKLLSKYPIVIPF